MKKISLYFVIAIISVFGLISGIKAESFPSSIKSSINYDVGYYGLLGSNEGWKLYAKGYSISGTSGKAFCTAFSKYAPNGITCKATSWSNNSGVDERVSAMIGSVINAARSSDGTISWDNYYYAELAINRLLDFGYTGNRGYGNKYNNLSGLPVNNGKFKKDIYEKFLSIANYTYNNFGKTKVTVSNVSYDATTGVAKAKVTCSDYAGKKINCNKDAVKKVKYTNDGTNWTELNATVDSTNKNYITANIGTEATKIQFSFTDKQCWKSAKNYNCGESYQSLTPNYLLDICKTPSGKSSIYVREGYDFEVHKVDKDVAEGQENRFIDGATVSVTKDGEPYGGDNSEYELIDGRIDFNKVEAGEYCITEVKAPDGYILNSEPHCVTVNADNPNQTIVIENKKYDKKTLTINKVDEKGNYVKGAKISVYSYDNVDISSIEEGTDLTNSIKAIETFVTDGENPHVIQNLEVGKTYTVVEEEFPEGYTAVKSSQEITISNNDAENVVTLVNGQSTIKVSKQSITSSKELPGAKLTITDAQGNEVASWTSTEKPQEIEGLADGDYTLTETTAPQGYTVAESIKFTIEDGKLKDDDDNTLVMKDATIVEVPDTFNIQNIIAMISGVVLVGLGTGVLFYETKKKKA